MGNKMEKISHSSGPNLNSSDETMLEYKVLKPTVELKSKAYALEKEILILSGLKLDQDIYYKDVFIDHYGDNYIHTLVGTKTGNKEAMVFVHGYQGSSITFYKMIKHLYEYYDVYCIDLPGMALSSRHAVSFQATEEWIDFYVESIEKFRVAMGLGKIYLVGHSLGAYLSSWYALKYDYNIYRLILFSPAGITDKSKGGNLFEHMCLPQKLGFRMLAPLWKFQLTAKSIYGNFIVNKILKLGLRKRYMVAKEESELLARLTEYALSYPQDLDKVVYYIFTHPIPTPRIPLEDILLNNLKVKCDIIFGETD